MTKTTRFAIAATLLATTLAFAAQDGFVLKRELKENNSESYRLEGSLVTNVLSPMGQQDITAETIAKYDFKTGAVDATAGTAVLDSVTSFEKLTMTGMIANDGSDLPKPVSLKGKLDSKGRITLDAPADEENVLQTVLSGTEPTSLSTLFIELPEKSVKIGDSWTVNVPANSIMKGNQTLTAKLVGEKDVDGTKALEVSLSGTLATEVTDAKLPESAGPVAGQKFSLKGSIDVIGTGYINPTTGQTISLSSEYKGKQTISLTDLGLEVEATSTLKTKSTLQK